MQVVGNFFFFFKWTKIKSQSIVFIWAHRSHPVESDGGSDGQASDTGVVPSEEISSCVNG